MALKTILEYPDPRLRTRAQPVTRFDAVPEGDRAMHEPAFVELFQAAKGQEPTRLNEAITALAHKVLVIVYHILRTKKPYSDLGADYFEQRDRGRIERHHIHRLEQLGYSVTLSPKEVA